MNSSTNLNGDKGITDLVRTKNVPKSDDRIELVGVLDELTGFIGVLKNESIADSDIRFLERIQVTLITISSGISDPYAKDYRISDEKVLELEQETERLKKLYDEPTKTILPGTNPISAKADLVRAVARRAERALSSVSVKYGTDNGAKKYLNRLGDYFYSLARSLDAGNSSLPAEIKEEEKTDPENIAQESPSPDLQRSAQMDKADLNEAVIAEVFKRLGIPGKITLDAAKKLIDKIEQEALRRGKKAVIAICTPDGNPVAVHVMDGAFLVSFDVAIRKAYTSVAVKMSTMELSKLAQPGGTFYGLESLQDGKIIIFGGGVPLKVGDYLIGGLGVSGGTGEEDHSLAEYGLSVLSEVL